MERFGYAAQLHHNLLNLSYSFLSQRYSDKCHKMFNLVYNCFYSKEFIMPQFTSVHELLTWIIYSGGAMLVASWILERIPAFQKLTAELKKYINMGVSSLLAIGGYLVISYVPAESFAVIDPFVIIISGIVIAYSGQQAVHRITKE